MHCKIAEMKSLMDTPTAQVQAEEAGGMTISHTQFSAGTDFAPLLSGLKDDSCQCPHWGYVLKGEVIVDYSDGQQEKVGAGEAYYLRPGHSVRFEEDTQCVEFSPTDELNEVLAHAGEKMAEFA
ncbi:cupin domain-containing protein [Microbulbifer flavimaris]|uniref:Cupin domain-containing protein n=1 Tax=Microbulbifer flavimaris TaxID=1781068 RepID=A0ABX4HY39_9GAMM|nr:MULTISPECIES: cupin domain-containing protein [Microbulbifer]KUJ81582.1 hypothetical protein AVO43_13615 [Microbulbifer sp. ZGT114]PCO04488.1 cupin domain-containing protein [Microbulbifer flavimaris]